jgi:hypothetical protein
MKMSKSERAARARDDRAWWQDFGDLFGWKVEQVTGRYTACFRVDPLTKIDVPAHARQDIEATIERALGLAKSAAKPPARARTRARPAGRPTAGRSA